MQRNTTFTSGKNDTTWLVPVSSRAMNVLVKIRWSRVTLDFVPQLWWDVFIKTWELFTRKGLQCLSLRCMSILDGRVCQRGELNFTSSCMKSLVQVTWLSRKRGSVDKMSIEHSFQVYFITAFKYFQLMASGQIEGVWQYHYSGSYTISSFRCISTKKNYPAWDAGRAGVVEVIVCVIVWRRGESRINITSDIWKFS